jgi:hypothetical protein
MFMFIKNYVNIYVKLKIFMFIYKFMFVKNIYVYVNVVKKICLCLFIRNICLYFKHAITELNDLLTKEAKRLDFIS